jgi:hypothetical protein
MKLRLDPFSKDALGEEAARSGSAPARVLRMAAAYYLADEGSGRVAWRVPRFLRGLEDARDLDVEVDDKTREALVAAARRQKVSVERLAEHALLYYLADLDSGRIPERIRESLERDDDP